MKRALSIRTRVLMWAVATLAAVPVMAGEGRNVMEAGGKRGAANPAGEAVRVAVDLAAWGRANESPAAIALAARILGTVECRKPDTVEVTEKGEKAAEGPKEEPKDVTPATLLAEANALCVGKAADLDLVDSIAKTPLKAQGGAVPHALCIVDKVNGHSSRFYTFTFRGGEEAWLSLDGDGDTDVHGLVCDENKNLVVQGTGPTGREFVRWWPRWTGPFIIEVRNPGEVCAGFRLRSN